MKKEKTQKQLGRGAILLLILQLTFFSLHSKAWGPTGHRAVGLIAERNLTPKSKAWVKDILGTETLAESSTWADEIRSLPDTRFLSPWHYCSVPDHDIYDSKKASPKGDVVQAIHKMIKILSDNKAEKKDLKIKENSSAKSLSQKTNENLKSRIFSKKYALRFLVHFIGDLHQPLHVGRSSDHGGNKIKVNWFGNHFSPPNTNLHSVWDSKIIEHSQLSYTELVDFVSRKEKTPKDWKGKSVEDWANESLKLRPLVYEFREKYIDPIPPLKKKSPAEPVRLKYHYVYRAWPVVQQRVLLGGLRLAETINKISSSR